MVNRNVPDHGLVAGNPGKRIGWVRRWGRAIRKAGHQEFLIHTGQHYDRNMSETFFEQLEIPEPDLNLGIGSGSHGRRTGEMLIRLEAVLIAEKPDWVLVYGDTNSTLAGALAAVKLHIPIAHVEAGLRSFNRGMPEEHNRVLSDHVSDLLFCPTANAVENLKAEGIVRGVHLVGDVMYDSVLHNAALAKKRSDILKRFGLMAGDYALATVHRAEKPVIIRDNRVPAAFWAKTCEVSKTS